MKIFTVQNLVFLLVSLGVFIVICTISLTMHFKTTKRIKTLNDKELFYKNSKFYDIVVEDKRERIITSTHGRDVYIDPYFQYCGGNTSNQEITLRKFVPKTKKFRLKKVVRFLFILLFIVSITSVVLSSILMLTDYFHQDLVSILHFEGSRGFFDYFKEYDVIFGSFFISALSFLYIILINDTIKTYNRFEIYYINMFNAIEEQRTYAPVYISVD